MQSMIVLWQIHLYIRHTLPLYLNECTVTVCNNAHKSLVLFNHCICTFYFIFFTFVSCLLTVTLHLVDVRLT